MENIELVNKYFIPIHSVEGTNNICRWINLPPMDAYLAVYHKGGFIIENLFIGSIRPDDLGITHWILQSDYDKLKKESP